MKRALFLIPVFLSGILASSPAGAQQTTFADVANGTVAPSSLKIADLAPDFKAMRLKSQGEASQGLMGSLGSIMMFAGMAGGRQSGGVMPMMFQLGALADLVWTKGQTVVLAGHEFLVTYRLNTGLDPASVGGPKPRIAADLTLNLVRTDAVTSIAPDPAMTPDALRRTLLESGAATDMSPLRMRMAGDDAVQAAILYPVFAQAKSAAIEAVELSNAKQIALASIMYANDYDDVYPYAQSTDQFRRVTYPYSRSDEIWKTTNPNHGRFLFAMNLAGVSATSLDYPSEAPLIYDSNAWPDGRRVVAFADGHVKWVTQAGWTEIVRWLDRKYPRTAKSPIKVTR